MLITIIFALLPIIFTILLGMLGAKNKHFSDQDANKLTKLILSYALPLSVFAGIWGTPRKIIIEDIPLAVWLIVSLFVCYILVLFFCKIILKQETKVSVLRALSIADPSVPFIGSAILPLLFSESISAIDIGICSLIINIILLPIAFALLDNVGNRKSIKKTQSFSINRRFIDTLKKPLVFSALLGFILSLVGLPMPTKLDSTFTVLGKAAGGLAMFTTGIILYFRKIHITRIVSKIVFIRNIILPGLVWIIMTLTSSPLNLRKIVILTLAIPTATMPTSLAIKYKTNESEIASIQLGSTAFAFVTLSFFMYLVN